MGHKLTRYEDKKFWGLNRQIFVLGWVSFFTDVSSEMIYPLLPVFLTSVLGASPTFLGLIEGVAEATASLGKLLSGWLSDRWQKRKALVVFGYLLSSVVRPLVALSTSAGQVLIIRFLDRVGKGIRTSPRDALIADSTAEDVHGKSFGFQRAMDHTGAVVGPLISFLLISYFTQNYRLIFALAFIPAFWAVFILITGVQEKIISPPPAVNPLGKISLKSYSPSLRIFLFAVIIFSLGNSSDAFLILQAKENGVGVAWIPVLWMILHVVKSLSATPGGILSDRWGRKKTIILGWLLYSAIYFGFAASKSPETIWVLFTVYGLFYGLTEGAERALVADLVPSSGRGTAFGLYNFSVGLSTLPASLLMGFFWEKCGAPFAFTFGACLAILAVFLLGFGLRK
ncbi:MAG: MFS transporter [Thermodesulfobacteriota bacterium]